MPNAKGASYLYAIFGISLVLFVLGTTGVFIVEAKRISASFKENLTVEIVLKDNTAQAKIEGVKSSIQSKKFVKDIKYVSKDDAAKLLKKDLGEDFIDVLGYNPLYPSFHIHLFENYANKDSFQLIQADLAKTAEIKQVNFQNNILESLDTKIRNATFVILIIAGALLLFSVSLIFSTIRLAMFTNRFTIKTEQLFGATRWFIVKPFLNRSLLNGFVSGLLACGLVAGLIAYFDYLLPELDLKTDLVTFATLFAVIILFGILVSFLSTVTAVFRYLRLNPEDLY